MSEPGSGGHVFLCYARKDSVRVDELERRLLSAGIPVWRDTKDLWPGQVWRDRIRRAITDGALVFLACFSSGSVARVRGYQNAELALAAEEARLRRAGDAWLIPVRFDDCTLPDLDLGGGRRLDGIQRADLFGGEAEAATEQLIAAVARILGREQGGAAGRVEPTRPAHGQMETPQSAPPRPDPHRGGRHLRNWMRRRAAAMTAAAVTVACAVSVVALVLVRSLVSSPPARTQLSDLDVSQARIIPTGKNPWAVALTSQAAWITNRSSNTVTRVDRHSYLVTNTIRVAAGPLGIATDPTGAVWVASRIKEVVQRINPKTLRPDLTIPVLPGVSEIVVDHGDLWATETLSNEVAEISLTSHRIVRQISVGGGPAVIAANGNSVWVGSIDSNSVSQINVATGSVVHTVSFGRPLLGLAADRAALWVSLPGDQAHPSDVLERVDLNAARRQDQIAVPSLPLGVASTGAEVWLVCDNASSLVRIGAKTAQITGEFPVGQSPTHVAVSDGQVWVTNMADGTVMVMSTAQLSRVHLNADHSPTVAVDQITVGNDPVGVAGGANFVWVTNANDGSVSEINPINGRVVMTTHVGGRPHSVVVGGGFIWVASDTTDRLSKIDPVSGKVVGSIAIPNYSEGITFANGSIWVTGARVDDVTRVNAQTFKVQATISVGRQPLRIAAGFGAIWVGNAADGTISRIDPSSNNVTDTINIGARSGGGVTAAFGRIWVTGYDSGRLVEIDPVTRTVVASISVGSQLLGITAANGRLWVIAAKSNTLVGVNPHPLLVTARLGLCRFPQTDATYAGYVWATCTNSRGADRVQLIG